MCSRVTLVPLLWSEVEEVDQKERTCESLNARINELLALVGQEK
jgi:hypothetical protein